MSKTFLYWTPPIKVGTIMGGGTVAYVDETGYHGLIIGSTPVQTYNWGPFKVTTNTTGNTSGEDNCNYYQSHPEWSGETYAMWVIKDLEISGYTDWYIPVADEFLKCKSYIPHMDPYYVYWLSTEGPTLNADAHFAYYGAGDWHYTESAGYLKNNPGYIIPMRKF